MNRVQPQKVGLSSIRLERINRTLQSYVDQHILPGVLAMVVRRGQIGYFECFGMMDIEANKPMQADTLFRIQSMTKPITSAAIMMLYEEGHFHLTDPVSKYIPEFGDVKVGIEEATKGVDQLALKLVAPEREMTICDLLLHMSGLVYPNPEGSQVEVMVNEFIEVQDIRRDLSDNMIYFQIRDESLKEWIPRLANLPLAHQPGTTVHYGFSTDVLGYLVEVVSGMGLEQFFQQRIFDPLDMNDTAFYVPAEKIHRLATLYHGAQDSSFQPIDAGNASAWAKPKQFLSGGGGPGRGLISTAADYARFAQMLLNNGEFEGKRLLSRKTVELMALNHLPEGISFPGRAWLGFGLGLWVMMDVAHSQSLGSVGSFGWDGGDGTRFWVDPKEEMIGIIMAQAFGSPWVAQDQFPVSVYQAIDD